MSEPSVRLALIGPPDEIAVWRAAADRLTGGRISITVESLESALNDGAADFDSAVICAPLAERQATVQLAAKAGKHVLLDAPVAQTLDEAEAAISACGQAGVCFAVGRTLRFLPSSQMITDRLANGNLGSPGLLRAHRWRSAEDGAPVALVEQLFADVDFAICVFGGAPTHVYAIGRCGDNNASISDYVQVHLGFESGGSALLDFSAGLPVGPGYDSLSLIGSTGAAYADDHHNTHLLYQGSDPRALVSGQGPGHLSTALQGFVNAINDKKSPPAGGAECRTVHRVIDAIRRSLESKRVLSEEGGSYV